MRNKGLIITLIIILSIISISLIIFMMNFINGKFKIPYIKLRHRVSNELVVDKIYNNDYSKVSINSNGSDIYIKHSNDDNIRIVIYGNKDKVTVNDNDKELKVTTTIKPCIGLCINNVIAKTEIYLPKDYSNSINIVNNYGDIKVDKYLNALIDIQEDCGDVFVKGGRDVTIENDYGDISLDEAENAVIKESAGDIEIGTVNTVTANNNFGDIKLNTVNNYLDLENNCGDIKVDKINIKKDSTIKDSFGDIKLGNTNEIFIDARTDLGDININNNYNKSDTTLKIKNDCGDIEVNN